MYRSDCCETSDGRPVQAACPVTGTPGSDVPLRTVKAILTDSRACGDFVPSYLLLLSRTACAVVLFFQQGELLFEGRPSYDGLAEGTGRQPAVLLLLRGKRVGAPLRK